MTDTPLGIDWGTSSLRVYDLGSTPPVQLCHRPKGIKRFPDPEAYGPYLDQLVAELDVTSSTVVLSGMITSQQGWLETSYLPTPASIDDIAGAATRHDIGGRALWAMPGVSHRSEAGTDVMRGEETQVAGTDAVLGRGSSTILLPGTHSKWVTITDGAITGFATYVTGELFELVSTHSIIGAVIDGTDPDDEAFDRGVTVGMSDPGTTGGLLATLFSVRTRGLLEPASRIGLASYLSGLLIGAELAGASRHWRGQEPILVVGDGDLVEAYRRALGNAGVSTIAAPAGSAGTGLQRLGQRIGLR